MGLPAKLKNMALFVDGGSYVGQAEEVTLPTFNVKTEAWRGGGMGGAAHIHLGLDDDALKMEFSIGGFDAPLTSKIGKGDVSGTQLRWTGAYQRDDTGEYVPVEIVTRGRITESDPGTAKVGDDTTSKYVLQNTYVKLVSGGRVIKEVDIIGMKHVSDGVDLLADMRRALGL